MTEARIYQPAKTAMQSGQANTRKWVLEFEPAAAKIIDPLMGWTGSADTREQVHMKFDSKDEAVAFAKKKRPRLPGGGAQGAAHPAQELCR